MASGAGNAAKMRATLSSSKRLARPARRYKGAPLASNGCQRSQRSSQRGLTCRRWATSTKVRKCRGHAPTPRCLLRSPGAVVEPSGNASAAATLSRKGVSLSTEARGSKEYRMS